MAGAIYTAHAARTLSLSTTAGFVFGEAPMFCETYTISETVQQHHCIRAADPDSCLGSPQWRYIYNTREGWPIVWMVEAEMYFGGFMLLRDDCMF